MEIVTDTLDFIYKKNPSINAFLHINQQCIDEAKKSEERYLKGKAGKLLDGIPIAIKDNICTVDQPTT
ncbi:MAG TPA: amidase family protein, partial [bacterium]|nr:amidase family protein [bacterium]